MNSIDGFKILGQLGSGGYGTVFASQDKVNGQKIAIKTLSHQFLNDDASKKTLQKEIDILRNINDRNIVKIWRSGFDSNYGAYYTMPHLKNDTFQALYSNKSESLARMVNYWIEIVFAVQRCHNAGIIHCDLKPENILFDNNVPIIVDFGIGRSCASTPGTTPKGTPGWSPPSFATRGKFGISTDIYGLLGILGWLLTGKLPNDLASHKLEFNRDELLNKIATALSDECHLYDNVKEMWDDIRSHLFEWKKKWVYDHLDNPLIASEATFFSLYQNNTNSLMPPDCKIDFYRCHPHHRVSLDYMTLTQDERAWVDRVIGMGLLYAEQDKIAINDAAIFRICSENGKITKLNWILGIDGNSSFRVSRNVVELSETDQVAFLEFLILSDKYIITLS